MKLKIALFATAAALFGTGAYAIDPTLCKAVSESGRAAMNAHQMGIPRSVLNEAVMAMDNQLAKEIAGLMLDLVYEAPRVQGDTARKATADMFAARFLIACLQD